MLLMIEKEFRGGICYTIHWYAKANNKYMEDYGKNKEPSYLKYWDVNNLYGWEMSQTLPGNKFECIKDTSKFIEDFIKNYSEESNIGYILEVYVQCPKRLHELHNDLPFLLEEIKTQKVEKLITNLYDKAE